MRSSMHGERKCFLSDGRIRWNNHWDDATYASWLITWLLEYRGELTVTEVGLNKYPRSLAYDELFELVEANGGDDYIAELKETASDTERFTIGTSLYLTHRYMVSHLADWWDYHSWRIRIRKRFSKANTAKQLELAVI